MGLNSLQNNREDGQVISLGEFVREVRRSRGWYQSELAKVLSVDQSYISMVENETYTKPPLDFVKLIHDRVLTMEEKTQLMLVLYNELDRYIEG